VVTSPMMQPTVITPPVVYPTPGYSPMTQPTFPSVGFPSTPMFPISTPGISMPSVGGSYFSAGSPILEWIS
jgi:hypothetical protein